MAKALLIAVLLVSAAACALADTRTEFGNFKTTYARQYKNAAEEKYRRKVFADNMKKAAALQKRNPLAKFGPNRFADMTADEFKEYHNADQHFMAALARRQPVPNIFTAPQLTANSSVDWRTKGAVTQVKDQGQCGSCWSFSAIGNIEGQWFLAGNELVSLSEQELVSCDTVDSGCDGGLMTNAFEWLRDERKGVVYTAASFPYVSGSGSVPECKNGTQGAVIRGGKDLPQDEKQMAQWMLKNGPIAIAVDATSFQMYSSGILTDCSSVQLDHGVLAVGFDDTYNPPYWIVKNSWGKSWGESGYIRVVKGKDACLISQNPCTAIV